MVGASMRAAQSTLALMLGLSLVGASSPASAAPLSYTYDALGRVISATYPNGTVVSFSYDPAGNRTSLVVSGAPGAPVANPVSATVPMNSSADPIPLNITGGAPTYVTVASPPGHGAASANATSITYTPTAGYTGADSFTYSATNAAGTSNAASVTLTVAAAPPVANPVSATVAQNSSASTIPLNITGGAPTYVTVASNPGHGSATASGLAITYMPASGFNGSDTFTYSATNGSGTSAAAAISITVTPLPPIASNVSASVAQNSSATPITLAITGGTPTYVSVASSPGHGSASASGLSISYTPTSGYAGPDSFTYTASNAGGTSAAATASITVNASSPTHVSPTPVWSNISASSNQTHTTGNNVSQAILGFTSTITLKLTTTGSGAMYYSKNNGAWTSWSNNATLTVVAGDTLGFEVIEGSPGTVSGTISVTNTSDSNTVLGSFTYSVSANGCIKNC